MFARHSSVIMFTGSNDLILRPSTAAVAIAIPSIRAAEMAYDAGYTLNTAFLKPNIRNAVFIRYPPENAATTRPIAIPVEIGGRFDNIT